jgi:hypothetical protein
MPDHRLPKKLLYGELQVQKQSQGKSKKSYKDTLKVSLVVLTLLSWKMRLPIALPGAAKLVEVFLNLKRRECMMPSRSDCLRQHRLLY